METDSEDQPSPIAGVTALPTPQTPQVFISYSRKDFGAAGLVFQALNAALGEGIAYLDTGGVRSTQAGDNWLEGLNAVLADAWVVVCIVGKDWAKKVMIEDDHLREELEFAAQAKMRFLPVILNRARMPDVATLPDSLKPIPRIQAEFLRAESISRDLGFIIPTVRSLLEQAQTADSKGLTGKYPDLMLPERIHSPDWTFDDRKALMDRARAGDAAAQHELGLRYLAGVGTHQSDALAVQFLRLAHNAGHFEATINLMVLANAGVVSKEQRNSFLATLDRAAVARLLAFNRKFGLQALRAHNARASQTVQEAAAALKEMAELGDDEALRELMQLADAGDMQVARLVSELLGLREAAQPPLQSTPVLT